MRYLFLIVILIHSLIHTLGFIKSFGITEIKQLPAPISKSMGVLWIIATLLHFVFGIMYFLDNQYSWLPGIIAVLLSQILIFSVWKDARFGTLPNLIILAVSIISYAGYQFRNEVDAETAEMMNTVDLSESRIISEKDIQQMPSAIHKWLHSCGMAGKPEIQYAIIEQKAELKMKQEQEDWMTARALQYTFTKQPAFIWSVDVEMNSFVRFSGRDKYANGQGEMLIKMHSLMDVVNETGEKLTEASLQRYLGEMVWCPSLALSPYITWESVNDSTAVATMDYKGVRGSGTFLFNSNGELIRYTALRYMGNEPDAKRYEWVLDVQRHKVFEGIKVPSLMTATWKLEGKDWTWLKLEVTDIHYNSKK